MNYPSLSLKQNLIDEVFSGLKYGTEKQLQQTSPSRQKMHDKIQKDLRLQRGLVEDCDQCEYKTSKFKAMYRHKRENHLVLKQKCTDCDYSNIYPNRVKWHFNRVHRGMKRIQRYKCRREGCKYAGTKSCSELESHSLFFCKQCQLSFERSDSLKFHNDKIHEGVIFNCTYCGTYSTARRDILERHILHKHSENKSRLLKYCKEEGCTYKSLYGQFKRHIETKHEGIVRFKCHVMNCNFRSSEHKELRRHAKTHEKEPSKQKRTIKGNGNQPKIECDQEGCNAKVINMKRHNKTHGTILMACDEEKCDVS